MKKIIAKIFVFFLVLLICNMFILLATIGQIASGEPTPHIPFWDAQIKAVASVLR